MELILPEDAETRWRLVQVYESYLDLLGRAPDKIGLFHCCRNLERGASLSDIRAGIVGSDEYRLRQSGSHDPVGGPARTYPPATGIDVLHVLFDGAVPVSNRTAYRWWLDELHTRRRTAAGPELPASQGVVVFVMPLSHGRHGREVLRTVASVMGQHDPRWQLIVVSGAPTRDPAFRSGTADPRITVVRGAPRIAAAIRLRRAMRDSGAGMTCLLFPGETVAAVAVGEIMAVSDADVVTSDGDALDRDGRPHDPVLAGGWDPDTALFREPAGLVAIRSSLLRKIWRTRWVDAGLQHRWDALLGAASLVPAGRIRHVPAVLLHRLHPPAALRPTPSIVATFLRDVYGTPSAELVDQPCGGRRVVYPIPRQPPLVSVIVPTRDQPALLKNCVDGILHGTNYESTEVIIVDNDSADAAARATLAKLAEDRRVTVLREGIPFNWGRLNAAGVRASRGEILVFLNDDIDVIEAGWLRELVSQSLRGDVGLVGAKLLYPSGGVQHAGIVLHETDALHVWRHAPGDYGGYGDQLVSCRTVSAVTGACMAMRRDVYDEVEGFEEDHLAVTWGDIDLCFRVRARGYRVVWTAHAVLHHIEQATRGPDTSPETRRRIDRERAYMLKTWTSLLGADPYFSPNLNLSTLGATLRTRFG